MKFHYELHNISYCIDFFIVNEFNDIVLLVMDKGCAIEYEGTQTLYRIRNTPYCQTSYIGRCMVNASIQSGIKTISYNT